MKKILKYLLLFLCSTFYANAATSLEKTFQYPPDETRPWCYWYWINANISKEGVTKDLEAMARVGIGTALIGNQYFSNQPKSKVTILSDEWWDITVHAVREGKRLGVDIGFFNCPGWSMSGGPWVKPQQSMRYLASSEKRVTGPIVFSEKLPAPGEDFQDVALLAVPVPAGEDETLAMRKPAISTKPAIKGAKALVDGDRKTGTKLSLGHKKTTTVDIQVSEAFTARSVTLVPGNGELLTNVRVQAWIDGKYQTIRDGKYDRRNKKLEVGPIPKGDVIISIPPTKSDRFKLIFTPHNETRGPAAAGMIVEIEISSAPRVEYAVEKQLGKMYPKPLPLWGSYIWPTSPDPTDVTGAYLLAKC